MPDIQYNGRVFDPGTGFHDYGARLYWPEIGRFISVDTAGPSPANPLSVNRYAYTYNNPYKGDRGRSQHRVTGDVPNINNFQA